MSSLAAVVFHYFPPPHLFAGLSATYPTHFLSLPPLLAPPFTLASIVSECKRQQQVCVWRESQRWGRKSRLGLMSPHLWELVSRKQLSCFDGNLTNFVVFFENKILLIFCDFWSACRFQSVVGCCVASLRLSHGLVFHMELAGRNDDGVEEEYSLSKIVKILNSIVDDFNSKTHRVHVSSGLMRVNFRRIQFANQSVSPTIFVPK